MGAEYQMSALAMSYKKILSKTGDEITMHDLLESVNLKNTRSRVDLRDNNYVVLLDIDLQTLYVYISKNDVDLNRLSADIELLTECVKVVTLFVNCIGKDIVHDIVTSVMHRCVARESIVFCMELNDEVIINNSNNYTLRKATLDDKISILSNIINETGITTDSVLYKYAVQDVVKKISNEDYYVLTSDECLLSQMYIFKDGDNIFIHGVLTSKDIRNKGVATNMVSQLSNEFIKMNKHVCLSVFSDNLAAIRTYEKVGFKQTGNCYCFYIN